MACAVPVQAEIEVRPIIVEAVVPRDTPATGSWFVRNAGPAVSEVTIAAVAYEDYNRGHRTSGTPAWITIASETVVLAPGAETAIAFRVTLPPGSRGESLALVFFSERPRGYGATMTGRLGTALYALASGTARVALDVAGFRAGGDSVSTVVAFEVANSGNVHVRPKGSLDLLSRSGRVVAHATLRSGAPILPGARETFFTTGFLPRPRPGAYRVRWMLDCGEIDGRPGPVLQGDTTLTIRS